MANPLEFGLDQKRKKSSLVTLLRGTSKSIILYPINPIDTGLMVFHTNEPDQELSSHTYIKSVKACVALVSGLVRDRSKRN